MPPRKGTLRYYAIKALQKESPLKVDEIYKQCVKLGYKQTGKGKTPVGTLRGTLHTNEEFVNVSRGLWKLSN